MTARHTAIDAAEFFLLTRRVTRVWQFFRAMCVLAGSGAIIFAAAVYRLALSFFFLTGALHGQLFD
jgi:hypothetical protein